MDSLPLSLPCGLSRNRSRFRLLVCLLAATVLLGLLPASTAAQDSLDLELMDAKGKKVANAQIVMTPEGGGQAVTGVSNKKGKYATKLPPGKWNVEITAPDFGMTKLVVDIEAGLTQTAKVTLVDEETARKQEAIDAFNGGVAKIQAGDEAAALELFEKAASMAPDNPDLADSHRLVALLSAQNGDIDRAESALNTYLALVPAGMDKIAPAAYEVYRARGETEKLPAARQALRDMGAATDLASKVFNEGVAKNRENDKAGAIALFTEAATLDPTLTPAYRSIAALHFNDQEYAKTLDAVERLLATKPDHREGLRMAFFSHFELDQFEQANVFGGRWISAAAGASAEIVDTANKTFEGNNSQDAEKLLEVVIQHDDGNALAHYTMGRLAAGNGDIAAAKKHLQRFLELSPNHPEAEAARQMLAGL